MKWLKQPNRWSCLPTALAILLDKPLEPILLKFKRFSQNRLESDGWTDLELVYVAAEYNVFLCPFMFGPKGGGTYPDFFTHYSSLSGILVGKKYIDGRWAGHALAKVGDDLIDPADGMNHPHLFDSLSNRIFFGWYH